MTIISIEFEGYWLDRNRKHLPAKSGIYCVYECTYNLDNKIALRKLIYIGEAKDVNDRVNGQHEKRPDWKAQVEPGNELCFSFGQVGEKHRERAEAALINHHQPPENDKYNDSFPFPDTTIKLSGEIKFLHSQFTVYKS